MFKRIPAPVSVLQDRLSRLKVYMKEHQLDLCCIANPVHQLYLIDCDLILRLPGVLLITKEGRLIRIIAKGESYKHPVELQIEVKEFVSYDLYQWADAQDNASRLTEQMISASKAKRVGMDFSSMNLTKALMTSLGSLDLIDLRPFLREMRHRKAPYEIERIRYAGEINQYMYDCIRQELTDGISEFELFTKMTAAAWLKTGEAFQLYGKCDLVSGSRSLKAGGPPSSKLINNGETLIVDLFPTINGYHADNCRSFAVGEKTDLQVKAHEIVKQALETAESMLVPGIKASDIFREVSQKLKRIGMGYSLFHHVGHGIGVEDQEAPFLIPNSNDILEEGMVISVEPGIYVENVGVRIENAYLVTHSGPVNLTPFRDDL